MCALNSSGAGGTEDPQTPPPPSLTAQVLPAAVPLRLATAPLGQPQCSTCGGAERPGSAGPLGIHAAQAGLDCQKGWV